MNQSRTNRVKTRRKRRKSKWIRMVQNTLVFSLLAVLSVGLFLAVDMFMKNGSSTDDPTSHEATDHENIPEEPTVALTFVGDVMMSGNVEKRLLEKGFDFPFAHVRSVFLQDDYTIANLETPVTLRGTPSENKEFVYKSAPESVPAMKAAGIDAVNLANNHSMDQGVEGLLDTFAALDENQIAYVGAGKDAKRAYAPVYVEKKGIRIALLGFSRVIPEVSWYAGKNQPGLAATYDPELAVKAIQEAKKNADLVVVIAHWGKEKVDFPVDHQKMLARAYIDAGADLIVGGHPHVLQGFEQYQDKWIAYSMGNFIFTRAVEPKTWDSMVLQATCTKTGDCHLKMLPYYAELGQAVPMNDADGAALIKRIESISENVTIEADGSVLAKRS
ncbi:CapA family protein [Brevibacillus reuszeri]|uniref:Capsule biosynthesis protein n=2 Tax=Brevibacillus reuszeri TaxID=54915 RepID=A0A0K9YWE6_9BACL|nr:CapA family protein [Brevibacillus reuszeri]KNB72565.1 capsule biosynthesis protein [Brevibacillus reuszeri]MED1860753.1 CapA family protein [Brevibacillus reuszeri]